MNPKEFSINKKIKSLIREELIDLIFELMKYKKENTEFITNKYLIENNPEEIIESYKNRIYKDIRNGLSQKGWQYHLNLTQAKRSIMDFKKISKNIENILELNIFLLKSSLEQITNYGEMYNESFYISYCKIFLEVILTLNENKQLIEKYDFILKKIVADATEGWGFKDSLKEHYKLLEK